jgi:hypothetical protein
MPSALMIVAAMFVLLSIVFFIVSVVALQMRRFLGMTVSFILVLFMLSLSALCYVLTVATRGYRVLTHEELAVVVTTEPTGKQQFTARLQFPDGRDTTLDLAGDQLYVDARILKWKPLANILGLHTAYELDRVGGRYADIEDEQEKDRTVFALARPERPLDIFDLRQKYVLLSLFLDADYGSASYITAKQSEFQVLVSTTGLLIRETNDVFQ